MIQGIVGKVGSGKSLKAVHDSLEQFCKGGFVATNLEFDLSEVARYCWKRGHRFRDSQYELLDLKKEPLFHWKMKRGTDKLFSLVYIDEAHLVFPASEYRDNKQNFLEVDHFVSQSRKFKIHVFFITQAWENLWGQLKRQALFIYSCRDFRVVKFPLVGDLMGSAMGLKWSRIDTASNEVLEKGGTKLSPDLFRCYSTQQVFDPMCAKLMEQLVIHEPEIRPVSWFERTFKKPCYVSSSSSVALPPSSSLPSSPLIVS